LASLSLLILESATEADFKGTRVTVADVLADVGRGLSWDLSATVGVTARLRRRPLLNAVQLAQRALLDRAGHFGQDAAAA